MIKAIIFDLDGTLANTLESMAAAANAVMDQLGLKHLKVDNFRYYSGEGADMLVRRCLFDAGDPLLLRYEEAKALYRRIFNANPDYRVTHYPGVPETIHVLKKCGLKLGVCTNKPHKAAVKLIQNMFGDEFDLVMGQQDGIQKKPDPESVFLMCKEFHVRPEECLYIGDTRTDMLTGKNAGMYTIGALWGFRDEKELVEAGADVVIETPEDLLEIYEDFDQE